MSKFPEGGYTEKQMNYALKKFSGEAGNSMQIARSVGYSDAVAKSPKQKIESKTGYKNAMLEILRKSDNQVLKIMGAIDKRGFDEYSNKDLINALTAIGQAWAKFNDVAKGGDGDDAIVKHNQLRTIVMNRIENQTVNQVAETKVIKEIPNEPIDDNMDF